MKLYVHQVFSDNGNCRRSSLVVRFRRILARWEIRPTFSFGHIGYYFKNCITCSCDHYWSLAEITSTRKGRNIITNLFVIVQSEEDVTSKKHSEWSRNSHPIQFLCNTKVKELHICICVFLLPITCQYNVHNIIIILIQK